jgi:hypothetical protein
MQTHKLESVFVGRDSHESRTRLISLFKKGVRITKLVLKIKHTRLNYIKLHDKRFFFFEKEHHNMRKFIITMGCFTMTFSKFNMIKNYEK